MDLDIDTNSMVPAPKPIATREEDENSPAAMGALNVAEQRQRARSASSTPSGTSPKRTRLDEASDVVDEDLSGQEDGVNAGDEPQEPKTAPPLAYLSIAEATVVLRFGLHEKTDKLTSSDKSVMHLAELQAEYQA